MQLDVASLVTWHAPEQLTLQFEPCVQFTFAVSPTVKSQLDATHTSLEPLPTITRHVAPSVHVESHTAPQLALHAAVVHTR